MEWLGLVEKLVASLAWPLVALVLGLSFKRSIEEVLERSREIKALGVTLKLFAASELLRQSRDSLPAERNERLPELPRTASRPLLAPWALGEIQTVTPVSPSQYESRDVPLVSPAARIEGSWKRLCRAVLRAARRGGVATGSSSAAVEVLYKSGIVPPEFRASFANVQSVRGAARKAPASMVSETIAADFDQTCRTLVEFLGQSPTP